jgi:ribonuclease Z
LQPRPVRNAADEIKEVTRWDRGRLLAGTVEHGVDCYGYRLPEDNGRRMVPELPEQAGVRGPAIGELQRRGEVSLDGRTVKVEDVSVPRPGQVFALFLDTRLCGTAERLAANADLLVCEATYLSSETQEAFDHHHVTAAQAAELARKANVRRLALTHFLQRYLALEEHNREASAIHPDVFVAEDLSRVAVPARLG